MCVCVCADYYTVGQMFRWFNNNKEWLTASRLPRMMKRLLNRAMALNPSENDDFVDEHPATSSPDPSPAILTAEFESKMEQMAQQLNQMAAQLNQTRAQLRQVQLANRKADVAGSSRTDEVSAIETRVNASLSAHQERLNMHNNMTTESLGKIVATSEQMAVRLATAEKLLETLQNSSSTNCSCPPPPPIPRWAAQIPSSSVDLTKEAADDETGETSSSSSSSTAGLQRFQWDMEREIEQLKLKLQLTAGDLEKSINAIQTHSDNTLRNFSSVYQEGMKTLATVLEDKVSMASTSSYDVITNATLAFGEDLQVLRQAVSSSAAQIQYLVGQDLKTVRGLEELRSGVRRHETNIQLLSTQLGDFKVQVQDQLNSIRNHFSQTVNEFYQKIVERQNAMSYRLSSVVDELSAVKGRGIIFLF